MAGKNRGSLSRIDDEKEESFVRNIEEDLLNEGASFSFFQA